MGEQEQSGLLRIVVVLGIIALIAGISIASVLTLKGKMASQSQNATQMAQDAVIQAQDLGTIQVTDSLDQANAKLPYLLRMTKDNTEEAKVYGDYVLTTKWSYKFVGAGTPVVTTGYQGHNAIGNAKTGSGTLTPAVLIPNGAKTISYSYWHTGTTGDKIAVFNNPDGSMVNWIGVSSWGVKQDGQYQWVNGSFSVDGHAGQYVKMSMDDNQADSDLQFKFS